MKKILAIDDQIDNLITIKAVIKSRIQNCNVLTALSGQDGIDIAIKEQPDTILLDIIMPEMNGYETCKKLKENELTKHIPIIMVTAIKTDSESRVKGLNIGADAFLSKPIDAIELSAQVNVMLRIKEAEDKLRAEKEVLEETVLERTYKLKESEEKYHSIFDGVKDGIIYIDKGVNILAVNKAFTEITGISSETVVGKSGVNLANSFVNIKQDPQVLGILKDLLSGKQAKDFVMNFQGKTLELSSRKLDNGKYVIIIRDITKQKKAETENRKLSTAVEQSPSVIVITGLGGKIEYVNPKFTDLTGYSIEEVIGKNPRILKSGEQGPKVYKEMWEAITSGKEWHGEFHNKKKNGELFWEKASISPIINEQGKATNYLKVAADITERKRAEQIRNIAYNISNAVSSTANLEQLIAFIQKELGTIIDTTNFYLALYDQQANILTLPFFADEHDNFKTFPAEKTITHYVIQTQKSLLANLDTIKKLEKSGATKRLGTDSLIWLGVPLKVDGKVIGVIALQSYTDENAYNESDKKMLEFISDQISMTILRKKAEEDLISALNKAEESEKKFRELFEKSGDAILILENRRFTDCNQAAVEMLQYSTKEEFLNSTPAQLSPKIQADSRSSKEKSDEMIELAINKGTHRFEWEHLRKSGKSFPVEVLLTAISKNSSEEIIHVTWRDITERKRAEQIRNITYNISNAVSSTANLEQLISLAQKELGTIIDTTNFYIALYNPKTNTISLPFMADEKDSFTTFPAGKTLTHYVIKTKKPLLATKERLKELENSGDIESIGTKSETWLGVPLKVDGKVIGVIALQSYTDENAYNESDMEILEFIADQISISIERKKAEDLLKKSKERFDLAVKATHDGIYDWNLVTNEIYYSEHWKTMLGYTDEELPNNISTWKSLSDQEGKEKSLLKLKEAIEQKIDHYDVEFRMKHKRGHWVNILSRAQIIYNEEGKAIRAVGTHVDLTEQKEAERNLKKALNKAKESDRLKSAFLANMSHEIRTPMNGILGFSQLLKEPNIEGEEQLKFINIIEKSGKRMLNIINDLIDISKIEAGQAEIKISEVEINKQTEYLYTFFKPEAEKAGLQLAFKNGLPNTLAIIKSDREKIYAILTNLIKNAIKYTNEGSIEFGYNLKAVADSTSSQEVLEFYVKDTGIGIAQDKQEAIFDRFVQADLSLASEYEGAGLGLAITKGYVEILGGKIWVESVEGQGSQFYFTLPYATQSDQTSTEKTGRRSTQEANPKKLNILIAEDNETSKIYLSTITKSISKQVMYARNGIEALEICKEKQDIDLILMDIKMPEMDGLEVTRKIREFNKEVIIIAQTAYALTGDREKALEAGCNDYISKPISKTNLLEMIGKHFI